MSLAVNTLTSVIVLVVDSVVIVVVVSIQN